MNNDIDLVIQCSHGNIALKPSLSKANKDKHFDMLHFKESPLHMSANRKIRFLRSRPENRSGVVLHYYDCFSRLIFDLALSRLFSIGTGPQPVA